VPLVKSPVAFVERHGIVLESSRGRVPSLAQEIAGEIIRGSWWGHPTSHLIFRATRLVRNSADVLVCRLVSGRITYVHRRLWPAIVRVSESLRKDRLAAIREEHSSSGAHKTHLTPFPNWVPPDVFEAAQRLSQEAAWTTIGDPARLALFEARTSPKSKLKNSRRRPPA
jgi:hypothetical protein